MHAGATLTYSPPIADAESTLSQISVILSGSTNPTWVSNGSGSIIISPPGIQGNGTSKVWFNMNDGVNVVTSLFTVQVENDIPYY